jgi:hypothetical protein
MEVWREFAGIFQDIELDFLVDEDIRNLLDYFRIPPINFLSYVHHTFHGGAFNLVVA